ncbi:hypothetical protein PoB_000726000 [Plakobranchus ocellatus]|uniref:Uncharacterized protein n=1 Tax=Plakobranchus ocellatus TaxID=259542 RepID=A0AAV3YE12_9GAST|nr:hypothetical protein PoB_000726000 [Plakobranchus ocellatus]
MGGSKRKKQTTFSDESTHSTHSNDEVFIKLQTLEHKLETLSNNNTQRLIDDIEIIQGTLHDLLIEQDNVKKDIRDLKDQRSILTDEVSSLRQTINELGLKVNEFEQYGRRANVRVFGLRDKIDETNAVKVKTVTEIIRTKLNTTHTKQHEVRTRNEPSHAVTRSSTTTQDGLMSKPQINQQKRVLRGQRCNFSHRH